MEHSMERTGQEDDNERALLVEGEPPLPAPAAEQPTAARQRRKHPLATWKGVLLGALAVLTISAGVVVVVIRLRSQVPSGREKWSRQIGNMWHSSSTISNGIIYIGTEENTVYALSAATGQVIWSTQLGHYTDFTADVQSGIVPSPVVSNGMVYANSQDGFLYALNARTGRTIWSFQVPSGVLVAPAVANGMIYIGSEDGVLYALDAGSGRKLWSYQPSLPFRFLEVSPVVANGLVYAAGAAGGIYALDAVSGRERWVQGAADAEYAPTVANGLIYTTTIDGELDALDATSGHEQWSFFSTHDGFTSSPIVVGKSIYIYSFAGLVEVDAITHQERWFREMDGTFTTPAVVKNMIYVIAGDRNFQPTPNSLDIFPDKDELDVLDAASGNDLWFYPLDGLAFSTPAVSNGVVYVGANDGTLYALLPPG